MRIESKKYLYDIARAAKLAIEFIEGKSFADYSANVMLRSGGCGWKRWERRLPNWPELTRQRPRRSANISALSPSGTF